MMLDILQIVLQKKHINFLVMTESTPTDVQQSLVDTFAEDSNMIFPVFLLSTKAGRTGINISTASVVIMYGIISFVR
jgi:SNF2 family DNA or RNA helicase